MSTYCLSSHASWTCRHSGACCRAGWAIPIEGPAFERVRLHFHGRHNGRLFRTGGPLPESAAAVLAATRGACVFFDAAGGRLCAIHRELGVDALPVACRQFPRQALKDARGVFVTLSHYCPTAAALLVDFPSLDVIAAPENLALGGSLEGLDATEALPPLLTPDLLMDMPGYDAWERAALALLSTHTSTVDDALDAMASATERVQRWRPSSGDLASAVRDAFAAREAGRRSTPRTDRARADLAARSIPRGLCAPAPPPPPEVCREAASALDDHPEVLRAYVGARLFGNWMAYYGHELATVVEYLRVCLSVLRVEAARRWPVRERREWLIESLRAADRIMVHDADVRTLARVIEQI